MPRLALVTAATGQLLTVRHVAERLQVSTYAVYKLCERGELEHVRVSNAIRIPLSALSAFIEAQQRAHGRKSRP